MPAAKTECLIVINDGNYFARHKAALLQPLLDEMRVTVASGGPTDGIPTSFSVEKIDVSRRVMKVRSDLSLLVSLVGLFRRIKPQLIISFTMKPTVYGLIAALLPFSGLSRNCRFVGQFPGLGVLFEKRGWLSSLARKVAITVIALAAKRLNFHLVFENLSDRELFVSQGYVKLGQTTVLSGTGIDLKAYSLPSARDPDMVTILWAGRLIKGKGLDLFCGAAQKLALEGNPNVRFLVAGLPDVNSAESISPEQLAGLLATPAITFLGHDCHIPDLLSRVDVLCHPSRYKEGLPRILLEAAASGVAIVASENFGTKQIVTQGRTGLLTENLTVEGVAGELRKLIGDPAFRKRLSDNAFKLVHGGGFDTREVTRELLVALDLPYKHECSKASG
jgi:glycosyltransferase involved in cell wall biosynthesis